eukprot:g4249.t1
MTRDNNIFYLFFVLFATAKGLIERPQPKPFFQHEELGTNLLPVAETIAGTISKLDFVHKDSSDRTTKLSYKAKHRTDGLYIARLDYVTKDNPEVGDIFRVNCFEKGVMQLHTSSAATASVLSKKLVSGALIAGGKQWGCLKGGKVVSILRRITSPAKYIAGEKIVTLTTSPAHFAEFFESAEIKFSTDRYPEGHFQQKHYSRDNVERLEKRLDVQRRLGEGWLSNPITSMSYNWAVKNLEKATSIVQSTVSVVKTGLKVINNNGNFNVKEKELSGKSWKWNLSNEDDLNVTREDISLDGSISCKNCYAYMNMKIHFSVLINNYSLDKVACWAEGSSGFNLGAHINGVSSTDADFDALVGTIEMDEILFFVGGIPISIDTTVPIHSGYRGNFDSNVIISATAGATGSMKFGAQYRKDAGVSQISEHNLEQYGSIENFHGTVAADLFLFVRPTIILDVEHMLRVTVGINPALEITAIASNDDNRSACEDAIAFASSLIFQATIGADFNIYAFGKKLYESHSQPKASFNAKLPINSGCIRLPPRIVPETTHTDHCSAHSQCKRNQYCYRTTSSKGRCYKASSCCTDNDSITGKCPSQSNCNPSPSPSHVPSPSPPQSSSSCDSKIAGSNRWWSCHYAGMTTCGSYCCCTGCLIADSDGYCTILCDNCISDDRHRKLQASVINQPVGENLIHYNLFTPGATWAGKITKISDNEILCGHLPNEPIEIAMQVLSFRFGTDLELISANNWGNSDFNSGNGAFACLSQSGFTGAYYEGDRSIRLVVNTNSDQFTSCTNGNNPTPYGWSGHVNIDRTTITAHAGDNCSLIQLTSVQPGKKNSPSKDSTKADASVCLQQDGEYSCLETNGCGWCISSEWNAGCTKGTVSSATVLPFQFDGESIDNCDRGWEAA